MEGSVNNPLTSLPMTVVMGVVLTIVLIVLVKAIN